MVTKPQEPGRLRWKIENEGFTQKNLGYKPGAQLQQDRLQCYQKLLSGHADRTSDKSTGLDGNTIKVCWSAKPVL